MTPGISRSDYFISLIKNNKDWLIWLALAAVFILVGTVGHDPWWKKGEAYSFGIIYNFYKTSNWLIPNNAGIPFMEKPPLYYWTGTILCHLLGSFIPLNDAARLASAFYMAISTLFVWLTARVLFISYEEKKSMTWVCASLFLGTYGTSITGHAMITDLPLVTGTAITIYGLAILYKLPENWKISGIWLGLGMGIAFLSKGLPLPVILGISSCIILFLSPPTSRQNTKKAILLSILVAMPFFLIWPFLLYQYSHALFIEWLWDNNIGRFLGFSVNKLGAENRRGNLLFMLPIFCFPIFPLACVEIINRRKDWKKIEILLPLIISLVGLIILFSSASFRTIYLMPLFPGLALLATQAVMRFPPQFLLIWNNIIRFLFSVSAIIVWIIWWNLLHPIDARPIPWLIIRFDHIFPPDFIAPEHQVGACIVAIIVTLFWLFSFRLKARTPLETARIFFTGAALIWCTIYTILMPWINDTRSFRSTIAKLEDFIQRSPHAGQCVANYSLGENMGPMTQYFMRLDKPLPIINLENSPCPLLITFVYKTEPENIHPKWKLIWRGTRLLDIKSNELRLYEKID